MDLPVSQMVTPRRVGLKNVNSQLSSVLRSRGEPVNGIFEKEIIHNGLFNFARVLRTVLAR